MIDSLAKDHNWSLPYNLNKYYAGFKSGNRVAFSVAWGGTYAWHPKLKLPERTAKTFEGKSWEFQRHDSTLNEALSRPLKADNSEVVELFPLLQAAYEGVTGKKLTT